MLHQHAEKQPFIPLLHPGRLLFVCHSLSVSIFWNTEARIRM
jgi:hypothetical protein